jgi:hypothetical protein
MLTCDFVTASFGMRPCAGPAPVAPDYRQVRDSSRLCCARSPSRAADGADPQACAWDGATESRERRTAANMKESNHGSRIPALGYLSDGMNVYSFMRRRSERPEFVAESG